MRQSYCALLIAMLPGLAVAFDPAAGNGQTVGPRSRQFRFTYAGAVTGLPPGQVARVWLPVPPTNGDQIVTVEKRDVPASARVSREPKYGNEILYFEAAPDPTGGIPFSVVYDVVRKEAHPAPDEAGHEGAVAGNTASHTINPPAKSAAADLFLQPDAKVPVGGRSLTLLQGKALPADGMKLARALYDVVDDHMVYSKEKPGWGNGDVEWACESKSGNCTDFHSLFISLARAKGLPAKFEIGFPLPDQPGRGDIPGYHCWAKVRVDAGDGNAAGDGNWVPVDISEANKHPALRDYYFGHLSENRVAFTTGRDLTLAPRQDGPPLNYFVYPYVEVGAKPYPPEKVTRHFSFEDANFGAK